MVKLAVAITTAPRPVPTLEHCVAALAASGCPLQPILVRDGDPRRGIARTWVAAVEALLRTDAEALMVLQDDVTWPPGRWDAAVEAIAAMLAHDPACGYLSLHTMPRVEAALAASVTSPTLGTWYRTGHLESYLWKHHWCGAQCWVLPRAAAQAVIGARRFQEFVAGHPHGFDHEVTATLRRLGCETYTWWPSLLSHHLGKGNRAPRKRLVAG